jgi:hypothetical protein
VFNFLHLFPCSRTRPPDDIIAQYEASAHPEYHPDRLARAFAFLEEVISVLGLTSIDAGIGARRRTGHKRAARLCGARASRPGHRPQTLTTCGQACCYGTRAGAEIGTRSAGGCVGLR